MTSALGNMTTREKIILAITVVMGVGALLYYAYLKDYIAKYQQTTRDIQQALEEKKIQEATLKGEERIQRQFNAIRDSVAIRQGEKSPQAAFIEDIASFVTASTTISPHWVEPVSGAPEYAYLVISFSGLRGPWSQISDILKAFSDRQLLIRHLRIQQFRPDADPNLTLAANLAQLVRVADLDPNDQKVIREALQKKQ